MQLHRSGRSLYPAMVGDDEVGRREHAALVSQCIQECREIIAIVSDPSVLDVNTERFSDGCPHAKSTVRSERWRTHAHMHNTHTHTCIHIYIIDELCNRPVLPLVQVGIMVADVTVVNLLVAAPAFLVRTFSAR